MAVIILKVTRIVKEVSSLGTEILRLKVSMLFSPSNAADIEPKMHTDI